MSDKHETKAAAAEHPVKAVAVDHPVTKSKDQQTAETATAKQKAEKPQTLQQKLHDIRRRVEAVSNSPFMEGKAEEFAECWECLDAVGTDHSNPADASMVQAAHNHLQHHAPRRASRIDALEAQLDAVMKGEEKAQAKPDTPQMAHVKGQIADLQTDIATDPRALPEDKQRAQELQYKVDSINADKATK